MVKIPRLSVVSGLSLLLVPRPCSEMFFSGYSGFPLSSNTNISKFQFYLDYYQALYHDLLPREIAEISALIASFLGVLKMNSVSVQV